MRKYFVIRMLYTDVYAVYFSVFLSTSSFQSRATYGCPLTFYMCVFACIFVCLRFGYPSIVISLRSGSDFNKEATYLLRIVIIAQYIERAYCDDSLLGLHVAPRTQAHQGVKDQSLDAL